MHLLGSMPIFRKENILHRALILPTYFYLRDYFTVVCKFMDCEKSTYEYKLSYNWEGQMQPQGSSHSTV